VGRQASHKDRETGGVLKDQDLLSDGMKFHLGERRGHLFCKVAAADAAFLSELKIMDYSLLVRMIVRVRAWRLCDVCTKEVNEHVMTSQFV